MSNQMCICVVPSDISQNNINGLAVSAVDFFISDNGDKTTIHDITKQDTQYTCTGVLQNIPNITSSDYVVYNGETLLNVPMNVPGNITTVKVCNSDNILKGDLLCISHVDGILQKQSDNTIHNYTIAKSLEDCTFFMDNEFFFQFTNPRNIVISQYTTFSYEIQNNVLFNDSNDGDVLSNTLKLTLDGNINIHIRDFAFDEDVSLNSIQYPDSIEIKEASFIECSNESHFAHESVNSGTFFVDNIRINLSYDAVNSNFADIPHPCNLVSYNSSDYGQYKMRIAQIQAILL